MKTENKRQKSTAPGIPMRSPIQALTGFENRCFQRDMAVDNKSSIFNIYKVYILPHPLVHELGQFFFYLNYARPHLIIHDIGYILHPSMEHFHNIPFSLFSLFLKSLRYYKLICLAQAGRRRRNDVIQTST